MSWSYVWTAVAEISIESGMLAWDGLDMYKSAKQEDLPNIMGSAAGIITSAAATALAGQLVAGTAVAASLIGGPVVAVAAGYFAGVITVQAIVAFSNLVLILNQRHHLIISSESIKT
jgi:hypothetical protein